jgi:hypothetical protein
VQWDVFIAYKSHVIAKMEVGRAGEASTAFDSFISCGGEESVYFIDVERRAPEIRGIMGQHGV